VRNNNKSAKTILVIGAILLFLFLAIGSAFYFTQKTGFETQSLDCGVWDQIDKKCSTKNDCLNYFKQLGATSSDLASLDEDQYRCQNNVCEIMVVCANEE